MITYKPLQNISSNPMMFVVTDTNRKTNKYIYELVEWAQQPGHSQIFWLVRKFKRKLLNRY